MRDVAVIGLGMHPWGKFAEKSVQQLCRVAVDAALKDAGVAWRDIEAVAAEGDPARRAAAAARCASRCRPGRRH